MCGISGFNFADEKLLGRMNHALRHRGPDDEGRYADERVSLGHRRLSIIDLSRKGHQPMATEDGSLVITYNGEVYNFPELRAELKRKGYQFRSRSDTEVILAAYRHFGQGFLDRLNGMFAFALYDKREGRLLVARDRFGVKPLYYYWDGRRFIFASEIKAILEHSIPREINREALGQFFTYRFNYGKETVFENVYKLPPGHCLSLRLDKPHLEERPWWKLQCPADGDGDTDEDLSRELRELLFDSVSKRLVGDAPLGFFLSGGLDSSIVTGIAGQLGARLESFSAGFETTNELSYAKLAARHFGCQHREVNIGDEALELLGDMVYHMDEPIGDAAFLATMILSREARKQVKVVLAGEGADELFAGYDRYKVALFGDTLSHLVPSFLKPHLGSLKLPGENLRRLSRILSKPSREARYLEVIRLFSEEELTELSATSHRNGWGLLQGDLLRAIQYFDVHTVLPNDFFMKADKMSSAWGLEERVPFLDYRLVEFAFRLPRRLKLRRGSEKFILKKAFADLLPPEILRRAKHGFDVPMDHWLRGPLYGPLEKLLLEEAHDLYEKRPVLAMLEAFRHSRGSYKSNFYAAQKLWSVLTFELWYRRFFG